MTSRPRTIAWCLLGAACGPTPPLDTTTDATATTTATAGPTASADPTVTSTDPTTDPTATTDPTGSTTSPPPECQDDGDCLNECGYCVDGMCDYSIGCCGFLPGPDGELELRCIGYECYDDDECGEGQACDDTGGGFGGFCFPLTPLPACERQVLALSAIPLPDAASALHLVDLNGDARLDLVVAHPDAGEVSVHLGDGAGAFAAPTSFSSGLQPGAQRIASGDLDLDGDPDLALLRPAPVGELSLLFGQDAMFGPPLLDAIGQEAQDLIAADLDGDGAPDLLARGAAAEPLTLRLGDGMGALGPEIGSPELAGQSFDLAPGQFDGDAARELAVTHTAAPGIALVEWSPMLGFVMSSETQVKGGTRHDAIVVGDINGDGAPDSVARRTVDGVDLLLVWSGGTPEFSLPEGALPVVVADVDGDGPGDVVALANAPEVVRVVYSDTQGRLVCVQDHPLGEPSARALVAAGDLDGDGKADLVAGSTLAPQVQVLRGGP